MSNFIRIPRYDYVLNALAQNNVKVSQKQIVDCACGDGSGSKCLKKTGAWLTAIDIDPNEVEKCLSAGIENVKQGDIRQLELPDNYCDIFFCSETLEHLEASAGPIAASEIQRVTRSGGHVCITVPRSEKSLKNKLHLNWVLESDLVAWFGQCGIVFVGEWIKNEQKQTRGQTTLVMIFRMR